MAAFAAGEADLFGNEGGKENEQVVKRQKIHIRKQQRNGRKCFTLVEGIPPEFNYKKIVKFLKKELSCNGVVVENEEFGSILQLQGDQIQFVADFLYHEGIGDKDQIVKHMA